MCGCKMSLTANQKSRLSQAVEKLERAMEKQDKKPDPSSWANVPEYWKDYIRNLEDEDREEVLQLKTSLGDARQHLEVMVRRVESLQDSVASNLRQIDDLESKAGKEYKLYLYHVGGEGRILLEFVDPDTDRIVKSYLDDGYDNTMECIPLRRI